jgi:hypothetical protein
VDEVALERAKQRLADHAGRRAGRSEPAGLDAALDRSREQIAALAATAAELQDAIPAQIATAVREALRTEVLPVARHLAEIRGLMNQAIRRLERLEGELLAERNARVDDLGLLVELVSSGWRGVDGRLAALERTLSDSEPVDLAAPSLPSHALPAQALPAQAEHANALAERAEAA